MLPISIVEKPAFYEFMNYLEPDFRIPTRHKLRATDLPNMTKKVELCIKNDLTQLDSINISLDGWSDALLRCYNGYIAQGIINIYYLCVIYIYIYAYTICISLLK